MFYWVRSTYRWVRIQFVDFSRVLFVFWVFSKHCSKALLPFCGARYSFYALLRQSIEELGLTYLKLGQFLAMRFDILPPKLSRELSHLFESVSPMPFEQAKRVIEKELQQPLEITYSEFEPNAIAAASVGQVHIAKTHMGETVAVKIQREGIIDIFETDMRVLAKLARMVDFFNLLGGLMSAKDTVLEFSNWTRGELNFEREGRIAERLRVELGTLAKVPKIYRELSSKRVLTMEFIEGYTLANAFKVIEEDGVEALYQKTPQLNLETFGKNLVKTVLYQKFVSGIFHGDPHPGNLIICPDNRVGLIDFGIFGELQQEQQETLAKQIERISTGDIEGSFRCLAKQYYPSDETDYPAFEKEVKSLMMKWYKASLDPEGSLKEQHLGNHSAEVMESARRHGLRTGTNTLLFWRSLYVLDATALKLRDYFNLFDEMRTFFADYRPSLSQTLSESVQQQSYQNLAVSFYQKLPSLVSNIDTSDQNSATTLYEIQITESQQDKQTLNRLTSSLVFSVMLFTSVFLLLASPIIPSQSIVASLVGISSLILWQRSKKNRE